MKKIVLFLMVLLMTVPVMAATNVTINAVDKGGGVVAITYNATGGDVSGFGLDINVPSGKTITAINDYNVGESLPPPGKKGYGIFPGTIDINATTGVVDDNGTPVAPSTDPGALGGLGTSGITIELGTLYTTGNAPSRAGTLCTVTVSSSCRITVALNPTRGGVVDVNALAATTNLPITVLLLPGKATNLTPANSAICVSITASLNWTPGSGATSQDVRFGTATSPPVVTTLPDGTTSTYSPAMSNNTLYYWRIDEKNASGTTQGDEWSFTTIPTIPAAPASCTVNGGVTTDADGKYTVTWTASTGATSYQLESKTTITPSIPDGWVQVYSGPLLTYSEKVGGGIWSYQVKASNACSSSGYTGGSNTCTISPLWCLQATDPGYAAWQTWRYPACWCYQRQCRGDGNGKKTGGFYVSSADFTLLKSALLVADANLAAVPSGICADLNHKKTGGFRVSSADFTNLKTYLLQPDVNVPSCDLAPVITGPYNFWTTP
jgi:hypothetical protein